MGWDVQLATARLSREPALDSDTEFPWRIIMALPPPGPLLTVRTVVALLIAGLVGVVAGTVGYFAYDGVAIAVLVGSGAAGSALSMFDRLLNR